MILTLEQMLEKKYINKITKGVYELGSIFKTFTVALALENNLVTPKQSLKIFLGLSTVLSIIFLILKNFLKVYQLKIY